MGVKIALAASVVLLLMFPLTMCGLNPVVMLINNGTAKAVERDLLKLPLPEYTEIISSKSIAGKIVGNGNGMQYYGAILISSELSLDELKDYYCEYGEAIGVYGLLKDDKIEFDRRRHAFDVKDVDLTKCYIVENWGVEEFEGFLELWDIRGH